MVTYVPECLPVKNAPLIIAILLLITGFAAINATASTVDVKYVGKVDLSGFDCTTITRSSFIRNTCYDSPTHRTVVKLNNTWYQYCGLPDPVYDEWLVADSMGRYYNAKIKRRYHC